jgi:hypothetical protein
VIYRHKGFFRRSRKSSVLFLLAAVFGIATLAACSLASAQQLIRTPNFTRENVNGNAPLTLQDAFNQARNDGHVIDTWRGDDNNNVWMSIDSGLAFTYGGAVTNTTPTVVPYGSDCFMVIVVGTDDHIWYSFVWTSGSHTDGWFQVPIQTTQQPVSAVQMGANSTNVFIVYHGEGSDNRIFQTWYNGQSGDWANAGVIQNGLSHLAPAVTYNPASGQLFVVAVGTNNDLWMTSQPLGAKQWQPWNDLAGGVQFGDSPAITATPDGWMVISATGVERGSTLGLYDLNGNPIQRWIEDAATPEPGGNILGTVELTPVGAGVFALYDLPMGLGQSGLGYNRRVF